VGHIGWKIREVSSIARHRRLRCQLGRKKTENCILSSSTIRSQPKRRAHTYAYAHMSVTLSTTCCMLLASRIWRLSTSPPLPKRTWVRNLIISLLRILLARTSGILQVLDDTETRNLGLVYCRPGSVSGQLSEAGGTPLS